MDAGIHTVLFYLYLENEHPVDKLKISLGDEFCIHLVIHHFFATLFIPLTMPGSLGVPPCGAPT